MLGEKQTRTEMNRIGGIKLVKVNTVEGAWGLDSYDLYQIINIEDTKNLDYSDAAEAARNFKFDIMTNPIIINFAHVEYIEEIEIQVSYRFLYTHGRGETYWCAKIKSENEEETLCQEFVVEVKKGNDENKTLEEWLEDNKKNWYVRMCGIRKSSFKLIVSKGRTESKEDSVTIPGYKIVLSGNVYVITAAEFKRLFK